MTRTPPPVPLWACLSPNRANRAARAPTRRSMERRHAPRRSLTTEKIFIDRDPKLFSVILNFMRTKDIDLRDLDMSVLRHEAEFYGITPLVKRLILCEDLHQSSCGDVLFHGYLPMAAVPPYEVASGGRNGPPSGLLPTPAGGPDRRSEHGAPRPPFVVDPSCLAGMPGVVDARPGSVFRVMPEVGGSRPPPTSSCGHSRNPSLDARQAGPSSSMGPPPPPQLSRSSSDLRAGGVRGHSRASSLDLRHSRNSSADFSRRIRDDSGWSSVALPQGVSAWPDNLRVCMVKGHQNWIAVAYAHFVSCYRLKDSTGWQLAFTSPYLEPVIERIALNAKVVTTASAQAPESGAKMLAVAYGSQVRLWSIAQEGNGRAEIGVFHLSVPVDSLFFIGSQLVALSHLGKVGVWHAMTQHWQIQDVVPITSFDTAGSCILLLGCSNGSIYYIDMQKFPLRMKDNDLLVTELYRDPSADPITAISVYLTPKTNNLEENHSNPGDLWTEVEELLLNVSCFDDYVESDSAALTSADMTTEEIVSSIRDVSSYDDDPKEEDSVSPDTEEDESV
ncbi:hypothetical protein HPB50_012070 [Hyalomma asiaticum]|uniref:Uncharacterized protein n=1 Tax=Hyalomma asiaticum TaxID=266040 RepID=A0ACB7RTA5_HYAAI|nr:hypothetical protein HPB50_012070 [Hyalomma asiaticum]